MNKYKKYVGQELVLMLERQKPMSSFCRAVRENIDEFSGQDFFLSVKKGEIVYSRFYMEGPRSRVVYTLFALPKQEWRMSLYKTLKKSHTWSEEHEYLEGYLLGYIDKSWQ